MRSNLRIISILAAALLLFLIAVPHKALAAPAIGSEAPVFTLPTLMDENTRVSLADFRGKVVLINIWASWCAPCRAEMPYFVDLQNEYGPKGFAIIAVNIDNKRQNAIDFIQKLKGASFTLLYDNGKTMTSLYNPLGMPTSYLIDQEGLIKSIHIGSFDARRLKALRQELDEMVKH